MKVYLDHHSTTPCDPRVVDAMMPYFSEIFGNPSALHDVGSEAKDAVELARGNVADIINADPEKIYFTSGASEANNIVLKGLLTKARCIVGKDKLLQIFTTNIEHSSVLNCARQLRKVEQTAGNKHETVQACVDKQGNLRYDAIDSFLAASSNILCVSIMAANNEIGTIYDIAKIGEICKKHDVFFHTDATQALGKVDIDVKSMGIDALSLSAHKIYGPKGVGALYLENKNKVLPLIDGGYQECVTSGTLNVPGIVGLGKACQILKEEQYDERARVKDLRNKLLSSLLSKLDGVKVNGTLKNRLPNNINLTIEGVQAEALVLGMDDVILSSGSACSSGSGRIVTSHVSKAIGLDDDACAIRIGLGKWNTEEEIEYASARIIEVVNALRSVSDDEQTD